VLLAFSLVAVFFDPIKPLSDRRTAYALLALYAIYSIMRCVWVWNARYPLAHPLRGHCVDLGALALLLFATGTCGPLLPLFALPLLSASLRWQRRGTLWTAAFMLLVLVAFGVYEAVWHSEAFQLTEFLIQLAWLGLAAMLLAELSAHEERSRRDLQKLATEPDVRANDLDALMRHLPRWAAEVLGAPRALVAWEEADEPWRYLASWENGESRCSREAPAVADLVAPDLVDADFLSYGSLKSREAVLRTSPGGRYAWWDGDPLQPAFRERFAVTSMLSVRFDLDPARGRLFIFDKPEMTSDDLVLAEIVARHIGARLNHFYLLSRLAEQAVVDERVRLGRDLHDGALHALAGVALEIEGLIRASNGQFTDAEARLRDLQASLVVEQRTLRMLIGRFRQSHHAAPQPCVGLSVRLKELVERVERRWGIKVAWTATAVETLPDPIAEEVYLAVHEGLTNAARHAEASVMTLDVWLESGNVKITISDNGRGFAFKGRFDQTALTRHGLGPATLRERAAALNGTLTVESSEHGTRLDLCLPVAAGRQ
jgi:signal transduction histidine kinase